MEFLDPVAQLLGISSAQLVVVFVAAAVLSIAWFVLKAVIKLATKVFAVGCFTILVAAAALYLYFNFFTG